MSIEYKCGFQVVEDGVSYCCIDYPEGRSPYKLHYPYSDLKCEMLLRTRTCPGMKTLEDVESSTWIHRMTLD